MRAGLILNYMKVARVLLSMNFLRSETFEFANRVIVSKWQRATEGYSGTQRVHEARPERGRRESGVKRLDRCYVCTVFSFCGVLLEHRLYKRSP